MAKSTTPAKTKPAKAPIPAVPIEYATLVGLLGKPVDDPAVTAMIAKAGKVTIKSDFVVAKEAGFDYAIERPEGARRKVLAALFVFPDGGDGHRGYADLPKGFAFTTRAALLASLPPPHTTWKIGKGKVPVATAGVAHDTWTVDGFDVCAMYRGGDTVGHVLVSLPDDATGGTDLSTDPLYFETRPVDAPKDAELVGMALIVAWAADRFGLPAKHAGTELGEQLVARAITPRTFLVQACGKTLTSLDLAPQLGDFMYEYLHHVTDDDGARKAADAAIKKLLHLARADARTYPDDFLATFKGVVKSPFHVPDSWDAVERIAPVLDARFADYQATRFLDAPDLKLYERAAKQRDVRRVTPDRGQVAPAGAADATLADDLVGLIGKSLKDKHVVEVLTRAGLPIGKRIDEQANPALGVAYMGTKLDAGGKKVLGVDAVTFFAAKQKSYIRGIGAEVQFLGYPGPLPRGLVFGESRRQVRKRLGKPKDSYEGTDYYDVGKRLRMNTEFKRDKLVEVYFGTPKKY
jgi:hypothetical protein